MVIFLSYYFSARADRSWYDSLEKPPGVVPDYVFSLIWTFLYIGLVTAGAFAVTQYLGNRNAFTFLYCLIIVMTLAWILLFQVGHNPTVSLDVLFATIALTVALIVMYRSGVVGARWYPTTIFGLFLLWICVASYYNYGIVKLNVS